LPALPSPAVASSGLDPSEQRKTCRTTPGFEVNFAGEMDGVMGPPLDSVGSAEPLESLIGMVIEPQREIAEGYEGLKVTTKKGEVVIGIIAAGNDSQVIVRDPEGNEHTLATADIASREMIGSLMPAGLTDSLSSEDLRDLFAYLTQLGKVK
jgi:quinoprotein glucose dehydrogenase